MLIYQMGLNLACHNVDVEFKCKLVILETHITGACWKETRWPSGYEWRPGGPGFESRGGNFASEL